MVHPLGTIFMDVLHVNQLNHEYCHFEGILDILPAQNMLSVTLTDVELRQVSWSTIGRWICWRTEGKCLAAGFQVSFRFPQPVTRPL